jgi:hypothetical protein
MSRVRLAFGILLILSQVPGALAQSPKLPATTQADPAAGLAVVTVKDMRVDYLRFRRSKADGTVEEVGSNEPVLLVTVEIANKGQKEITYKTANGVPGASTPGAALRSADGKTSAVVQFDATLERLEGVNKQATIKPGESVTDVLAFMQLPQGVKPATLFFPAHCIGGTGTLKISLEGK